MVKGEGARKGLLAMATCYTFLFVGAIFGWGPMEVMLEDAGAFASQCAPDEPLPCPKQSETIINIGMLAICTNCLTPFAGFAIDKFSGPNVATYYMSPMAIGGAGIVSFAAFNVGSYDYLFWIGFSMLGLATFCGSLLSVQVGLYFSGQTSTRIIMFLNALFDAGSVTYLFLMLGISAAGLSFGQVTLVYFFVALFCYGLGIFFWNTAVPESESGFSLDDQGLDEEEKLLIAKETMSVSASLREFAAGQGVNGTDMKSTLTSYRESLRPGGDTGGKYGAVASGEADKVIDDGYVNICDRSPKDQLLSVPFACLVLFFSFNMLSCNWTLTTAAAFLSELGDDGKYLSLFTMAQPASVLAVPLVDMIVGAFGFVGAFHATNCLAVTTILLKMFFTNLNIVVLHGVTVAVMRCFLYAGTFSYLPQLLGPSVVGSGAGILSATGGFLSFLNMPLVTLSQKYGFYLIDILYLGVAVPTFIMGYVVGLTIKKEGKAAVVGH